MSDKKIKEVISKTATCGLVMPISTLDGCSVDHWAEVKGIISEAVETIPDPKFTVKLVSDADDVGVIQKRIVQNVYSSDVLICDVSGKNPNVMFELGLRLAFDKATIIVKDDKTDYSFDTGVIEHLTYPRDLRFGKIVEFKRILALKVAATYKAAASDPDHSPFLKNFGKFQVANLTETQVSPDKLVFEMLTELQGQMVALRRAVSVPRRRDGDDSSATLKIAASIQRYKLKRPEGDTAPLGGSGELYNFIEKDIEAPKFFPSREQFVEAVDRVVKELA